MKPFIKYIYGDKTKKAEPEHHEFRFPGGTVNIQRTSNNEYWVHVEVVTENNFLEGSASLGKLGQFAEGRMDLLFDWECNPRAVTPIPDIQKANHIAVLVTTDT